jgi:hypothetical protein
LSSAAAAAAAAAVLASAAAALASTAALAPRHFWFFEALMLVTGFGAVRPGEEQAAILHSQISLCFAIAQPAVTQQTGRDWQGAPGCSSPRAAIPAVMTRGCGRCRRCPL